MALRPNKSRSRLDWHLFTQTGSGDYILALPPFYARLFEGHFSKIIRKARHGFRNTQSGKNKRAFFSGLTDRDIRQIDGFIEHYKQHIILGKNRHIAPYFRDEVDACVALDFGRPDPQSEDRTEIGELEYLGKYKRDEAAQAQLVKRLTDALRKVPPTVFPKPRWLTYIPADPDRGFYLPELLAEGIIDRLNQSFWGHDDPLLVPTLTGSKGSAKNMTVADKIELWADIVDEDGVELSGDVEGDSVCIVDDLYQSGASLWSFADVLKQAGAGHVVGVVCVKSLRDTDNQ